MSHLSYLSGMKSGALAKTAGIVVQGVVHVLLIVGALLPFNNPGTAFALGCSRFDFVVAGVASTPSFFNPIKETCMVKQAFSNGTNGIFGHSENGDGRVTFYIGGGFGPASPYAVAFGADIAAYADVPAEEKLLKRADSLVKIPLAEDQTFPALAADGGSDRLRELQAARPGINLKDGMGQVREVGYLAACKLMTAAGFQATLQADVFHPLLIKHNCVLENVAFDFQVGAGGGTGGPGAIPFAEGVTAPFLSSTNAKIRTNFTMLGPLTFLGLGPRIGPNAAACVAQVLVHALCGQRDPRETRSVTLVDAPPVGSNKPLRDTLVMQLAQATTSSKVQERLDRWAPNRAFDTPLGVVTILRPWWFQWITALRIAGEAANAYLPEVEELLRAAATPGVIEGIKVEFRNAQVKVAGPIKHLAERLRSSRGKEPEGFSTACTEVKFEYASATVTATVRGSKVQNLEESLAGLASEPCASVGGNQEKLCVLTSTKAGIERELRECTNRIEALDRKCRPAQEELKKVWRIFFPRGHIQMSMSWLADRNRAMVRFENAVNKIRETGRMIAQLNAEKVVLNRLKGQVDSILALQLDHLGRLPRLLATVRPSGSSSERFVELAPLDSIFGKLLQMAVQNRQDPDELIEILGSAASRVTLQGLVQITQSHEPTPAGIALQLLKGESAAQAPYWGGEKPAMKGHRIIVLPPVAKTLEDTLRNQLSSLSSELELVCADTARAGVNVMCLDVYHPTSWDDIFTRLLRKELEVAKKGGPLYFPGNADCLAKLNALADVPGAKL